MSHKILFYPVGFGDTSQIVLENGKRFLFDFRHVKKTEKVEGPEINLAERLKNELKESKSDYFDVFAITHGDKDHIENSTEFFELEHAEKYKGNGRIKIKELWVPAAVILETATNDEQSSEFVTWRQEARHRLKAGKGIRVFSKPDLLKDWLKKEGLSVESRKHLITDAGQLVPGFTLANDGIEFFCHSPFIKHVDENEEYRNEAALIFNIRLQSGDETFDYLAVGDSSWEILEDIVNKSKHHKNTDRLRWDIYNIPHHCSYLALSDEKGEVETTPKDLIKELLLEGNEGAYLVSSSEPIKDSKEAREQSQPPHIQARKCYEHYLKQINGTKFLVTMEESKASDPQPIVFKIGSSGITLVKSIGTASAAIISKPAPRAGK